ncbi:unnamed protein product [Heligmosomoides polygyrus]|uniref:Secreted protein n=1 Tax=Heligmosomoides polygyrus TaxID=6339 RepID=A0A183F5J1_HELPZ|nr:unnamed protein product [Heligmosomoides polygyrus]
MPFRILVLLAVVSYGWAVLVFYNAKVGDRVELNLGKSVISWKRMRGSGGKPEFIRYCTGHERRCKQFVDENNMPAWPPSFAHVTADGVLIFDRVKKTDAGSYVNADAKPTEYTRPDGSASFREPVQIELVVI